MSATYLFPPPPTPSVAVQGRPERFPVHRIYCVGRNYAEHAREMGHDPEREPPFFFSKPADAVFEAAAIWGHGVGIDLTKRDLQAVAKAGDKPWDVAKGFDHAAVSGALLPLQ